MAKSNLQKIKEMPVRYRSRPALIRLFKKHIPNLNEDEIFKARDGFVVGSIDGIAYAVQGIYFKKFFMRSGVTNKKTPELIISNFPMPPGSPLDYK